MAQALLPRYAQAQTVSFTDSRIKAQYVTYPSPGGNSGQMRGYLVQPAGQGPFPAVLVIHENRGLNPYVEDVARRAALDGFLALAPDGPIDLIPHDAGLIVADAYSAEFLREPPRLPVAPARRRAMLLAFARHAADRLLALQDPHSHGGLHTT